MSKGKKNNCTVTHVRSGQDKSRDKSIQKTENNDRAKSEGNTETKYTDTNDMTRNR